MPLVWRIVADTPDYESDDLTGKGAELTGGRWNRKGTPLIYTSQSVALACLETLVHLGDPLPLNRYLVQIEVPQSVWDARTRLDGATHVGWDAEPAGLVSLEWGRKWAQSLQSIVAEVTSIVVPEESTILLNLRHRYAVRIILRLIT